MDFLASHPSTAKTITTKLARRFLADDPPQEIVEKASRVFLETSGDIKAVLKVILLDGLPHVHQRANSGKYKRPLNYLVSALRQTGSDTNGGPELQRYLRRMGQPLYDWPTPDGYPDTAAAWQGNLLPRWQFALDLAQNNINGTEFKVEGLLKGVTGDDPDFFLERVTNNLLGRNLPIDLEIELLKVFEGIIDQNPYQAAGVVIAGILASPTFQWR